MHRELRALRRPWRELRDGLLDLVLPPACVGCGAPSGNGVCPVCRATLVDRPVGGCNRCGDPVPPGGTTCGTDHRELRHLAFHVAPFAYAGTGGVLVRRFKLDADAGAGRLLVRAMVVAWWPRSVDCRWRRASMVPVPLHPRRLRVRGFDQALWLARELAVRLDMVVAADLLMRTSDTLPQGDPRVTSRDRNVEQAFALRHAERVVGRRFVLVDDVLTSGATGRACARLLVAAGAAEVAMLTACRS